MNKDKVVNELLKALREAKAWAIRGEGTPEQNGAKCDTWNQASELIDSAIELGDKHSTYSLDKP